MYVDRERVCARGKRHNRLFVLVFGWLFAILGLSLMCGGVWMRRVREGGRKDAGCHPCNAGHNTGFTGHAVCALFGFTQAQAEGFAELAQEERQKIRAEIKADLEVRDKLDESERSKLATKGDIADVRLEIEKLRSETKTEIEKLRTEAKGMESRLIKWQIAIAVFSLGIMAKGFGWLGF